MTYVRVELDIEIEEQFRQHVLDNLDIDDFVSEHKGSFDSREELKTHLTDWVDGLIEDVDYYDLSVEIADNIDCGDFYDEIQEAIRDELCDVSVSSEGICDELWEAHEDELLKCIRRDSYDYPKEMHRFPVPSRLNRISAAVNRAFSEYSSKYGYAEDRVRSKNRSGRYRK